MTKKEHIGYWLASAEHDWEVVQSLVNSGQYLHSLFFAHLTLEKLLKGHWIKDKIDNYPPRIHSLVRLVEGTNCLLDEETMAFLELLNDFQLEGRYPDYQFKIYKRCTKEFTVQVLDKIKPLRICLIERLQSF
jgi:HEPN domain-containing protein